MNNAYLLGRDGTIIPVLNHPSADFEFDSVLRVLTEYICDRILDVFPKMLSNKRSYKKKELIPLLIEIFNSIGDICYEET